MSNGSEGIYRPDDDGRLDPRLFSEEQYRQDMDDHAVFEAITLLKQRAYARGHVKEAIEPVLQRLRVLTLEAQ